MGKRKANPDVGDIPSSGLFNPYDYIDSNDYLNTAIGNRNYQHDLASLQYIAAMRQQEFVNEYNSPANQARLMREAGLNPDLLGLDGVSDSSSIDDPSFSGANVPTRSQEIMNIFSVVSSTFSMASSLMTGGLQMFSGLADLDAKNISNVASLLGLGKDYASMSQPVSLDYGSSDILDDSIESSIISEPNLPLSRRNHGRLKRLWNSISNSPQVSGNFWGSSREAEEARQETAKVISSPYNADDFNEMVECFRPVTKAISDNLLSSLDLDSKKLKYDNQYYDTALENDLAQVSAGSDYAARKLSQDQDIMMSNLKRPLQSLIQNLDKKASDGKNWANFALISLYTALSATVQRSTSSSVNGSTGELFENKSLNFGF